MPLLIDGHNLIGRMPDISLADLDDEVELVQRLRRYCMRHRRRATVVFDRGLPSGRDLNLSSPPVTVVFAPLHSTADAVIKGRINRARDPRGLLVVSSDREVQQAARRRRAQVVSAEEFAARLSDAPPPAEAESKEAVVSEREINEWLELFGGE